MSKKSFLPKLFLILFTLVELFFIVLFFVPDSWIPEENRITPVENPEVSENENIQEEALENPIALSYEATSQYKVLKEKYQQIELLESIFSSLGSFIELPSELTAEYAECGEENAFYDPETQKITLCYEIIEWVESISKDAENPDEVAMNILMFFTLHEVGHALIDLYELPITGREEDVADQLATFFLLGSNDAGALDTADSFYSDISWLEANELPFADEHSLDHQRYYNILCWVYGSDTMTYEYLVSEDFIPEDRAEICESEYITLNNSFLTLLDSYIQE